MKKSITSTINSNMGRYTVTTSTGTERWSKSIPQIQTSLLNIIDNIDLSSTCSELPWQQAECANNTYIVDLEARCRTEKIVVACSLPFNNSTMNINHNHKISKTKSGRWWHLINTRFKSFNDVNTSLINVTGS